jgi:hypothetical protein
MRIIGFLVVGWLMLQVYPHIHIDFASMPGAQVSKQRQVQVMEPMPVPVATTQASADEVMDPYPNK